MHIHVRPYVTVRLANDCQCHNGQKIVDLLLGKYLLLCLEARFLLLPRQLLRLPHMQLRHCRLIQSVLRLQRKPPIGKLVTIFLDRNADFKPCLYMYDVSIDRNDRN